MPIIGNAAPQVGYEEAGIEPPIDDVLRDPMVSLRAQADVLSLADVERVVIAARIKLGGGTEAKSLFSPSGASG